MRKSASRPEGLETAEATELIERASGINDPGARIDFFSSVFMGRPYIDCLLGGGPELEEDFRATLRAFDCVTYIETVLALSLSTDLPRFAFELKHMRYDGGQVGWRHRNHYMIDWARNNEARGRIAYITEASLLWEKRRTLNLVEGIAAREVTFEYFPKRTFRRASKLVRTGDIILFVSTRKNLDVFHTGFLVVAEGELLLRHATRSAGSVIEQKATDFLKQHRMPGFILLRPICKD
jgi:hypothetical protein